VIEEGRRGLMSRIKAMTLPGKYRKVSFVDVPYKHEDVQVSNAFAKLDSIMHSPGGDDHQAGRQVAARLRRRQPLGLAHLQRPPGGLHLGHLGDDVPDPGAHPAHQRRRLLRHRVPPAQGHLVQPGRPPHRPRLRLALPGLRLGALWRGLSQSYFSRGYLEEVNAGNANTSNWLQGGGINQDGEIHAVNSFEASSCGTGACAIKDGLNHAAAIWNPEGDMGDIEIWEMAEPLLYLGRNVKANSGGYGKYRGGCGFETLRMVWNAQDWTMFFMGNGYMNSDWGLMGGYPRPPATASKPTTPGSRSASPSATPAAGRRPDPDLPDYENHLGPQATVKRDKQCMTTEDCYDNHDLYLNYLRGGPGFGDPIDREVKAIDDLNKASCCRSTPAGHGVVPPASGWLLAGRREGHGAGAAEIRKERLARSVPTRNG
jgi:acetone carboxylase alpha subunit